MITINITLDDLTLGGLRHMVAITKDQPDNTPVDYEPINAYDPDIGPEHAYIGVTVRYEEEN